MKRMSSLMSMHFIMTGLFNRIDEVISLTIQAAQDLLKRKLERVRKALEIKEREKDVILKGRNSMR